MARKVKPPRVGVLSGEMLQVFDPRVSSYVVKDGIEYPLELEAAKQIRNRAKRLERIREIEEVERWKLMTIRCARGKAPFGPGHLYVHGYDKVAFTGQGRNLRRALLAVPGVNAWQTGEEEFSVWFYPSALPVVAEIVQPRRRPSRRVASP